MVLNGGKHLFLLAYHVLTVVQHSLTVSVGSNGRDEQGSMAQSTKRVLKKKKERNYHGN